MDPAKFLIATRDTGYKSTSLAVAELVDNAIQAEASTIVVEVSSVVGSEWPLELTVTDNGTGMEPTTLAQALTFGGSTRFNDRSSLGRYGMGLPNAAMSRARRVDVYTWTGRDTWWSRLDVDELTASGRSTLPRLERLGTAPIDRRSPTGTAVRLSRCDRLEYKRPSALVRRLEEDLGRIFRHFIFKGLQLFVNRRRVAAIDPLFLHRQSKSRGAVAFGDPLAYELRSAVGTGTVKVRFSELPVERWHTMPSDEKRSLGVTGAPPVSVVRADREIDRGWFFMGDKRRENYDDWWRCEVRFDPALDELFGLTHSKQAICPRDELTEILAADLEPIGRALNSRVRSRFEMTKATVALGAAEQQANRADAALPPLPRRSDPIPSGLRQVATARTTGSGRRQPRGYQIVPAEFPGTGAYEVVVAGGRLTLFLNTRHPLYRDLYGPLAVSESPKDQETAKQLALAVLAAARAEAGTWGGSQRTHVRRFRQAWSDVIATFLTT